MAEKPYFVLCDKKNSSRSDFTALGYRVVFELDGTAIEVEGGYFPVGNNATTALYSANLLRDELNAKDREFSAESAA